MSIVQAIAPTDASADNGNDRNILPIWERIPEATLERVLNPYQERVPESTLERVPEATLEPE